MKEKIEELNSLHFNCINCLLSYGACQGVDHAPCYKCENRKKFEEIIKELSIQSYPQEESKLEFEYIIDLYEGFHEVMSQEETNEVKIIIKAKNRATAQRMIAAMLKGAPNVKGYDGICVR